jgi:hypothetical protein
MDLAADILQTLTAAGCPACPRTAGRIARELTTYGDIERAAAALAHDEAHGLLSALLTYRAALAEQADPSLRARRLRREAADLDVRADALWAQAAQDAGKASFRRLQGEHDLAAAFQSQADAAERMAASLEAQAFAKRLEAAGLQADHESRTDLLDVLQSVAA